MENKKGGHSDQGRFLDDEAMDFFRSYLGKEVPSGQESAGQDEWEERIRPFVDRITRQVYGGSVATVNPDGKYSVVLEAHADEVAWMVSYIMPNGYIRVEGTADPATALGRSVVIHTRKGPVDAVIGWPAIHMRKEKKEPKIEELFLDCGCNSKKDVEKLGVTVGCTVVYSGGLSIVNGRMIAGRALDNRLGGFILTEVARALKATGDELPFALHFVNAVQEEIGTKGATMSVEALKPDIALVTDVTHDTSMPHVDKAKFGDISMSKGPVISYGPALHHEIVSLIEDAAEKEKIPFQRAAAMKTTGSDADAFAYGHGGTRCALISPPIKYMHTPVEACDPNTVRDCCRLILATLRSITEETFRPDPNT